MLMMPGPRELPYAFESERLLLRCPLPGDGLAVNAGIQESLPELSQWMEWARTPPTMTETETNLQESRADFIRGTKLRYLLVERESGEFVGIAGLHGIDWNVPRFEIGYWCCTSFSGRGLITEAARALTRLAFEHLGAERVQIHCDAQNARSMRVAERAGFHREGILRNGDLRPDGSLEDTMVFSMVRDDPQRANLSPVRVVATAGTSAVCLR